MAHIGLSGSRGLKLGLSFRLYPIVCMRAATAPTSLSICHVCADSPENSLLDNVIPKYHVFDSSGHSLPKAIVADRAALRVIKI